MLYNASEQLCNLNKIFDVHRLAGFPPGILFAMLCFSISFFLFKISRGVSL